MSFSLDRIRYCLVFCAKMILASQFCAQCVDDEVYNPGYSL
jgi:hypothetical protein